MQSGIYRIVNKINGKCYVGSAKNLTLRFNSHRHLLENKKHHSRYLQNAWNKYGSAAFEFEIIALWEPEFLISFEQLWFDWLKPDYNIRKTAHSMLGFKHGQEMKDKLSAATKKRFSVPGSHPMQGRFHSAESRAKMSRSLKGRVVSPETKLKMSKSRSGTLPAFMGMEKYKHLAAGTPGHPSAKSVVNDLGEEFFSIRQAAAAYKIGHTAICNNLAGYTKRSAGRIWKYKNAA